MKQAYLFGHTGSINRGCEAIVRSTADILEKSGFPKVNLMVHNADYDKKLGLDKRINMIQHKKYGFLTKVICAVAWRYLKNLTPEVIRAGVDLRSIKNTGVVFNIGGDTYCYKFPYKLLAQNRAVQKYGIKNIFWGCSVDERVLENKKLIDDINRYSYIVTRETLSYQILKQALKDEKKLFLACDPAFNLKKVETPLPENFVEGNTVGINLSPIFFEDYTNPDDIMRKNVRETIDYILNETDMVICLVPHVYDAEHNLQDIAVLKEIASEYGDDPRIAIVCDNLSCEELKYIISKCRFFVGARTHSMIAAYSTAIPALALSYSIKSRGIAKDLYGDESLVVRYKEIKNTDEIKNAFKLLVSRENELKIIYRQKLEAYKKTIFDTAEKIAAEINNK